MQFIKDTRPCVVTRTGRQIPLSPQWAYKAVNYQVQSVAGDIFKQSLIDLDKAGLTKHLLLPIHDEVIAEAPHKDVAEVSREIEQTMSCDFDGVPIVAEAEIVGYRWGDKYAPQNRGD
jgi:DNA polymerase-1